MDPYQQYPHPTGTTTPVPVTPNTTDDHHTKQKGAFWEKAKHGGKAGFDKVWAGFEKLGAPVNKLTNKIGSEAFWPTTLGPESDKAARILKSFCKDGFYKDAPPSPSGTPVSGPKGKPKVLVKIPQKVIQNCVGLAIFTVMRTGLWVSGAGGSGVLIARKEDGSWSPPSGILIHTLGVGFMAGIDIYDCVVVINNRKALEAFSKLRVSLGGELSVVAGPVGAGGILESEVMKDRKPVWSYVKSRGLYGGLQVDGTVIVERNDENARFYGERLTIGQILAGHIKYVPNEVRMLMEVVKAAEGRTDVDSHVMAQADAMPPPGDVEVEKMSEPTHDQKIHFAPPPGYAHENPPQQPPRPGTESAYTAASTAYQYPSHTSTSGSQQYSTSEGYQHPPPASGLHDTSATAYQHPPPAPGAAYQQPLHDTPAAGYQYPPPPPTSGSTSQQPVYDPSATAYQHPARTDSGFAAPPPPGTGIHRTDSGFAAPPPGGPPVGSGLAHNVNAASQGKQDPDGPPRYA